MIVKKWLLKHQVSWNIMAWLENSSRRSNSCRTLSQAVNLHSSFKKHLNFFFKMSAKSFFCKRIILNTHKGYHKRFVFNVQIMKASDALCSLNIFMFLQHIMPWHSCKKIIILTASWKNCRSWWTNIGLTVNCRSCDADYRGLNILEVML
jgi:hypothetical protein